MPFVFVALKIQISQSTKADLDVIGGFITEERGEITVKVRPFFIAQ